MSVLGLLCAYVTGLDSSSSDVVGTLQRGREAARCAYAQQMRRNPHTDVGEAIDSQPSLAERVRVTRVVDILKDEKVDAVRAACAPSSFFTAKQTLNGLEARHCLLCQVADNSRILLIVKRKRDWIVVDTASQENPLQTPESADVLRIFESLLKTSNSRVVGSYVSRR
jgi:hypothetical protein